jgi:hypothetical protein
VVGGAEGRGFPALASSPFLRFRLPPPFPQASRGSPQLTPLPLLPPGLARPSPGRADPPTRRPSLPAPRHGAPGLHPPWRYLLPPPDCLRHPPSHLARPARAGAHGSTRDGRRFQPGVPARAASGPSQLRGGHALGLGRPTAGGVRKASARAALAGANRMRQHVQKRVAPPRPMDTLPGPGPQIFAPRVQPMNSFAFDFGLQPHTYLHLYIPSFPLLPPPSPTTVAGAQQLYIPPPAPPIPGAGLPPSRRGG